MKKIVYLDNAAATPIAPQVIRTMTAAMADFGNPSSFNDVGRKARVSLQKARQEVAQFLGARPDEIVFTGSGSESNSLAIQGVLTGYTSGSILTTAIEHASVLEACKKVPNIKIRHIPIDKTGEVLLPEFEKMLNAECRLVSVMYANNEIGTIEPIKKIAKLISAFNKSHKTNILFHVDACQATEYLDMNVQRLGVDLLTLNGSKIYGPRGTGVLYIRRGTPIRGFIVGGSQERGLRAGTENLPGIAGLAKALGLINPKEIERTAALRDYAITQIKKALPESILNGSLGNSRLPNNINICIPGLESEIMLLELDKYGIYAGSGSACTSHSVEPSHVLKAIGVSKEYIDGALRFSLGRQTTKADIDYLVKTLKKVVPVLNKRYQI